MFSPTLQLKYPNFPSLQSNWQWYTGEAFLAYWLNSILNLGDSENQRTSQAIARNYQSCNKIAEVVDRHIAALSPSHLEIADPLLKDLLSKWERENAGTHGSPLEEAALLAKIDGVAYLRLFFKKSYTEEAMADALEVHCPVQGSVRCLRDNDGFLKQIDYIYVENSDRLTERQFLDRGQTVFQILKNDELIQQFALDLGGGFTIVEINLPAGITDSIRRNQNAINFALTLMPHNLAYNGWIQESILNAQPPGTWSYDEAGREKFIPNPAGLPSGAGIARFLQGLPLYDDKQNLINYTQPDLRLQQPIDPTTFIATHRTFSQAIYEQSSQGFVLGSDLPLSGISREQSRRDFANIVNKDAQMLGYAYSDLLSVSNYLLGIKQKFLVKVLPRIDRGIEHKQLILAARKEGLISKKTAIEQLGLVADVEAELARLEQEKPLATVQVASGF